MFNQKIWPWRLCNYIDNIDHVEQDDLADLLSPSCHFDLVDLGDHVAHGFLVTLIASINNVEYCDYFDPFACFDPVDHEEHIGLLDHIDHAGWLWWLCWQDWTDLSAQPFPLFKVRYICWLAG